MHFFICTSGHVAHRLLCSSAFQCAHPTNPLPLTCFSTLVFFFSLTIGFPVHWFAAIAQPTQLISLIPQSPPHPNDRHLHRHCYYPCICPMVAAVTVPATHRYSLPTELSGSPSLCLIWTNFCFCHDKCGFSSVPLKSRTCLFLRHQDASWTHQWPGLRRE